MGERWYGKGVKGECKGTPDQRQMKRAKIWEVPRILPGKFLRPHPNAIKDILPMMFSLRYLGMTNASYNMII